MLGLQKTQSQEIPVKIYLMGLVIALSGTAAYAATPSGKTGQSEPTFCEKTVIAHGMLSRAQFECGYSQYNQEMIDDSAKCFKHELKGADGDSALKFGMFIFDQKVKEVGKKNACSFYLKQFPDYVRK